MSLLNMIPCRTQHRSHTDGLMSWVKKCEASYYDDGTEKDGDKEVLVSLSSLKLYLFFSPSLVVKMPDQEKMPPIWSCRAFTVLIIANLLVFSQTSILFFLPLSLPPFMSPSHIIYEGKPRVLHRYKIRAKEKVKSKVSTCLGQI